MHSLRWFRSVTVLPGVPRERDCSWSPHWVSFVGFGAFLVPQYPRYRGSVAHTSGCFSVPALVDAFGRGRGVNFLSLAFGSVQCRASAIGKECVYPSSVLMFQQALQRPSIATWSVSTLSLLPSRFEFAGSDNRKPGRCRIWCMLPRQSFIHDVSSADPLGLRAL